MRRLLLILLCAAHTAHADGIIYAASYGRIGQINGEFIYSQQYGYVGRLVEDNIYSAHGYVGRINRDIIYSTGYGNVGYILNGDWHLQNCWFLGN